MTKPTGTVSTPGAETGSATPGNAPGSSGAPQSPARNGEDAPRLDGSRVFQRLDTCAGFPYSLSEYARRALWIVVYALLIRHSPGRLAGWRRFWLKRFGAKIAPTCNIRPSARIRHPWLLEMGDYSTLADDVEVYNLGPIRIGAHTVISQNVHLCNGTHDYRDPSLPLLRPEMTIGSGVWVCADAFVGPGVTIGDNALVGARAVAMRDIPADVIASGNPCKVVRDRPMDFEKFAPGGGRAGNSDG